ncbi:hypothetical protein LTR37_020854 [Vermiconidia calcicola]|uniref:Uncharacterized protein n=1 Tax=Vermiconidia calcicola TaxID=1690605 RepID=A0ACC3MAB5_9PEZI|nr:hypothetical protein LTR37_020854 [Vermiconidia calcicola]
MPTPSSGRDSRRSSKSGPSGNDAYKSSERKEKAKSSQVYDSRRRGSKQVESGLGSVDERPKLKGRTSSAPLIEPQRHAVGDGEQTPPHSTGSSTPRATQGGVEAAQDEDEVAGVVGAIKHYQPFQSPEVSEPLPDINIAVLGAEGVGKSTFVQQALDFAHPPTSQAATRRISLKGTEYLVRLLELPIDDVDIDDDDHTVSWPETIEDKIMPRIDGALTLYNIKDEQSLEHIPQMLNAINKAGLPSVLISCKCDAPAAECEVDPFQFEDRAKRSIRSLHTLQASAIHPETHKRGLSMILRAILSAPPEQQMRNSSGTRQRAHSNAVRSVSPRPPSHTRATSEYTGSVQKDPKHSRHDSSVAHYGTNDRLKVPHEASQQEMHGSFLFEESPSEPTSESDHSSPDMTQQAMGIAQPISALIESGATFDELVDRLLAQPASKADSKFAAIFLALYRKFAAPGRLLEAIVERFDALNSDGNAYLIKTMTQLRYVAIMEQWVGTYPGDFAFPKTKKRMRIFVGKLSSERIFAVAAKEISADLDAVQEDDDTNWAYSDKDRASRHEPSHFSMSSTASTLIDDPSFVLNDDFLLSGSTLLEDPSATAPNGGDPIRSMSSSTLSSQQLMINLDAAQKQAELLQPIPRQPLSKVQWRLLMEYPDDVIARELTRMDWIMFSSIRPRDLVRQVSLTKEEQSRCKNLSHVNRMIEHFNQLAFWVANYILLRDKPKHRALMMEKMMRIGRKVRELNNYNALGAVIAGIKSTSVHRLAATRELIPPNVGKSWMQLELLMAPSKSHGPYRLAWENSSSERIPYLPLHRRDLVSAQEGNKTFIGNERDGRINWKKFEIMGEVIVSMQKAQGMPYKGLGPGRGNEQIKEMVLDVKLVKDEDELFERSKQVEPTGSTAGGTSTKIKEFFKR